YNVQRIIRVGTAGGIASQVGVGDVVVATGAHTDSSMNQVRIPGINFSAVASFNLARVAVDEAQRRGIEPLHVGTIVSRDHFYLQVPGQLDGLRDHGVLGVEMEAAAMYGLAAEHDRQALAVLTVSDHMLDPASRDMS